MGHQASFSLLGLSWPAFIMLAIALGAAAVFLWRVMRPRAQAPCRLQHAHDLIQALDQYCEWVEAQRHIAFFTDESTHIGSPLERARAIKQAHFPELSQAMVEVLVAHTALVDFFWRQQVQRMKAPEQWAASGEHDATYLALRQRMLDAVRQLAEGCRKLVGDVPLPSALTGGVTGGFTPAGT